MRKLNERFHLEGEEIIKTSNGQAIPHDEPLFIFRGRDRLAAPTLSAYRSICVKDGCNDFFLDELDQVIRQFQEYTTSHLSTMKQPGVTKGR